MPKYSTHATFNLTLSFPLILAGLYIYIHPTNLQLAVFSLAFIYTTLFMHPDMDVAHKIKKSSLRGILSLPFIGYAKIFKHRGISHTLMLGSLTRILWLSIFILIVSYVGNLCFFTKKSLVLYCILYQQELLYGLIGIFTADASHLFLDKLKSS
jgi:uncharacterized metal-binding protein